jgi:hypothetical protein
MPDLDEVSTLTGVARHGAKSSFVPMLAPFDSTCNAWSVASSLPLLAIARGHEIRVLYVRGCNRSTCCGGRADRSHHPAGRGWPGKHIDTRAAEQSSGAALCNAFALASCSSRHACPRLSVAVPPSLPLPPNAPQCHPCHLCLRRRQVRHPRLLPRLLPHHRLWRLLRHHHRRHPSIHAAGRHRLWRPLRLNRNRHVHRSLRPLRPLHRRCPQIHLRHIRPLRPQPRPRRRLRPHRRRRHPRHFSSSPSPHGTGELQTPP